MKKKIILGSILAVFIMMMLPLASAGESETAIERNKLRIYIEELQEEITNNNPEEPTIILRLLLWIKNLALIVIFAIILLIMGAGSNNTTALF